MNDLFTAQEGEVQDAGIRPVLATVGAADASKGVTLIFDGQETASQKYYKLLKTGTTPAAGTRVLAVKMSGTYIVLGAIGTTGG